MLFEGFLVHARPFVCRYFNTLGCSRFQPGVELRVPGQDESSRARRERQGRQGRSKRLRSAAGHAVGCLTVIAKWTPILCINLDTDCNHTPVRQGQKARS